MAVAAPRQSLQLAELLDYVGMVLARGIPGSVWVQAEIAALTDRRHLYLDLVQHDEAGREIAKTRANLWAGERAALEGKFRRATGAGLRPDTKVLLSVVPEFHTQYGFSLTVIDLAPEFTLGDMRQKLDRLRETLLSEGSYEANRALPLPEDFGRVAVLSPKNAAGLGDFRREADRLSGVCDFVYFEALFQGRAAPASLLAALSEAHLAHAADPFDALVLIRGGGASTDLAWLNDLDLARALARFPVPVITGIGHARDDTILDEVAARRCDTPSKAIALIVNSVLEGAREAEANFETVQAGGRAALRRAELAAGAARAQVLRAARQLVGRRAADLDGAMRAVLGLTPQRTLRRGYALVRSEAGVVSRADEARRAGRLTLEFQDGVVDVTV